ncbi:MAG: sugar ABC transporter ATP-binding protein [Actinomycetota bacterium]|nr:sugar ABC transporter ATP-binding protein [Actinomycetota bacterium]
MEKILDIKGVSKSFPGVKALKSIDFDLFSEEIHCLVGENGAGKSTFIKILAGAYIPDEGNIWILNKDYKYLMPLLAIELGIQTVYQESILVPTITVAENIFLGNEKINKYRFIDIKKANKDAKYLLETLEIQIDPKKLVEQLTTAERQMIGIVKALSRKAKILILDEPTASLSSVEIDKLLKLISDIKKSQVGIIYISHHLEEVFKIGDRITVLKDGKKINTHENEGLNHDMLIREMVGRPANLFYFREKVKIEDKQKILEIKNFSKDRVIRDVSFSVKSGEIFGIGGMVGSGRTELARMLVGVDRKDSGELILDGKNITPNSPLKAIKNGICLLSEGRQRDGLILVRSVNENISLAQINISNKLFIDIRREYEKVNKMAKDLRIVCPTIQQEVKNLSGGNQQKVVLAKWLFTKCSIFIFDEPTLGIDIGSKEEIYKIMTQLLRENKIIIMISSDMPELLSMSDRIGIMRKGEMVSIVDNKDITEEKILTYSIGVK